VKEQDTMKPSMRWKRGKLFFTAEAERRVCFVLTLVMLVYGAVTWALGG